jgi:alkylhydroperoxidase family enzyme
MPRLGEIAKHNAHATAQRTYELLFGERDPVAEPGTSTGTPGNWWTVFANAPDIFDHCIAGFQLYRSPKRKLDPKLRELGQIRVGWARGSLFVFSQHCKACRGVGIPEEKIAAIPHWQVADCFSELERALLAYTDALVYDGGRVADGVFAVLKKHLSDEQILEFTYITALYDLHAVTTKALRLEYDDVPERMTEVAAPAGVRGDPMGLLERQAE